MNNRTEISSFLGENHIVDPIKDLIPVCSNCHSMLHRTKPALAIETLRTFLTENS